MTAGAAHGKDPFPTNLVDLAPRQMQDAGADHLNPSAMPLLNGASMKQIEVLMVPIHEQSRKRPVLQPVKHLLLRLAAVPDPTEVAADDHIIILAQVFLLREGSGGKPAEVSVGVSLS